MAELVPLEWRDNTLVILDQTKLPGEEVYLALRDHHDVTAAIKRLAVRGAPAIGIAAAYGVALGALASKARSKKEFDDDLNEAIRTLAESRPTARNLFWALERMGTVTSHELDIEESKRRLVEEAIKIHAEQRESDLVLARNGAAVIRDGDSILTHCNAGALATGGYGTALGVIKQAFADGKRVQVYSTETRPLLQGARLTACELKAAGIPFTLITDSMAGYFMHRGRINAVVVGADRIAANGDTANKIGTYTLAVLAKAHGIPFYVAAPISTIDTATPTGDDIVIEEREPGEVSRFQGVCTTPDEVKVANPAFDVTPHEYITAIMTEKGLLDPQHLASL